METWNKTQVKPKKYPTNSSIDWDIERNFYANWKMKLKLFEKYIYYIYKIHENNVHP